MATKEVQAADVIRIVLQFLKENGLQRSFETLQDESQIALNTVENPDQFFHDIQHGRWENVLRIVPTLRLSAKVLIDLFEHIVLEMIELHETEVARTILRGSEPLQQLRLTADAERYSRLEQLLTRASYESREFYPGGVGKDVRRTYLVKALKDELNVVAPSRLLALLSQSMKFQQHKGMLPPGTAFDLFRGTSVAINEEEQPTTKSERTIQFGSKSHAECARFSPDGQHLVTGSVDGFVEVWDYTTGKINLDLPYQAQEQFMMHDSAVLCLAFSSDSDMLASGDKDGRVKVWLTRSGKCVRKFEPAHTGAVSSLTFSRDGQKLISTGFDNLIRLHGLVSGKTLKMFRGHISFVNDACLSSDNNLIFSAGADGTVRVWDVKSCDCIQAFRLAQNEITVNSISFSPKHLDQQLIICNRTSSLYRVNTRGEVVKTYHSTSTPTTVLPASSSLPPPSSSSSSSSSTTPSTTTTTTTTAIVTKSAGGKSSSSSSGPKAAIFLYAICSPRGEFIYAVADDMQVYCFHHDSAELLHKRKVSEKELIGLAHHPHRNLLATYADDGTLQLWKS